MHVEDKSRTRQCAARRNVKSLITHNIFALSAPVTCFPNRHLQETAHRPSIGLAHTPRQHKSSITHHGQVRVAPRPIPPPEICDISRQIILPPQVVCPREMAYFLVLIQVHMLRKLQRPTPPQVPATMLCALKARTTPSVANTLQSNKSSEIISTSPTSITCLCVRQVL